MERKFKAIHGWLGVLILPWVVMLGLTGLYLNHTALVKSVLPNAQKVDLAVIGDWPDPQPATPGAALSLAQEIWPDAASFTLSEGRFRRLPVINVETDQGIVSVVKASGHYWQRWTWEREFHAPDGALISRYISWGGMFKRLHSKGWITRGLGSWLADIAAAALVIFGASGLILFFAPRLRRRKNRRARARMQASS